MIEEHSLFDQSGELPGLGKLQWNCRRGMKELEVVFLPFLEYCYDALSEDGKRRFVRLLGFDDASLFAWFMGYETPEDQELHATIQEVQHAVACLQSGAASTH